MEYEKPQGTIYDGSVKTLTIIVEVIRHFSGTMRLLETKLFQKKATVPLTKTFLPSFSRIIEHQKGKTTIYKGSQGVFVFIV